MHLPDAHLAFGLLLTASVSVTAIGAGRLPRRPTGSVEAKIEASEFASRGISVEVLQGSLPCFVVCPWD